METQDREGTGLLALAWGVLSPGPCLLFFAASRVCKVHFETVSMMKCSFYEWLLVQAQSCHQTDRALDLGWLAGAGPPAVTCRHPGQLKPADCSLSKARKKTQKRKKDIKTEEEPFA